MLRTNADGNDGGRYTEGDPGLGVPATVVGAKEMNNIQEELCNAVLDAGLALDGDVENQLVLALEIFFARSGITQLTSAIANASVNQLIANTLFSSANCRKVEFDYQVERQTDSQNVCESGKIVLRFYNGNWSIDWTKDFDTLAGVDFDHTQVDLGGGVKTVQLKYTSDDLTGTTYVGNIYLTKGRILI